MTEIIQMDAHTWRFEDGFVRFFLLEGEDRAAMIDSGVNSPDALDIARTLTDKTIILLNTHGDGDHTSGTNSFAEIHMHALDYINCEVCSRYPNTSLAEIHDGEVIELGNRPLRAIHIPGHTKGSLAFLDMKERALFAGDSVQKGHIYMFGAKRDVENYESSLEKLMEMNDKYDKIYASHDEFCLPKDYVEKVKAAWLLVRSGSLPYEMIDLFSKRIKSYTTEACGFYLE